MTESQQKSGPGCGQYALVAIIAVIAGLIVVAAVAIAVTRIAGSDKDTPTPVEQTESGDATPVQTDTGSEGTTAETPSGPPEPTRELGTSNLYIEYVLDASGSMNDPLPDGTVKLEVAKNVLANHLVTFRPETNIGLRAYGHRVDWRVDEAGSCRDIESVAPVIKGQMENIVTWLGDFEALGMTPINASLEQSVNAFVYDPARINSIILLSDGIETCGGDPCQLIKDFKAQGINFTIHVIGLNVDQETREQLSCIADAAGGIYQDANSEQDLVLALNAAQGQAIQGEIISPPNVPTPTPDLPTPTPSPTTEGATDSPAETPTLEPSAVPEPLVQVNVASANLREGPGANYKVIQVVNEGDTMVVLAKNSDGSWYNVRLDDGTLGWISASVVTAVDPGLMGDIPVAATIPAPPPPTATSTSTPEPTPTNTPEGPSVHVIFTADRLIIGAGECVTVSWVVNGAISVRYQGQTVGHSGSHVECPTSTTRYLLEVEVAPGEFETHSLTVRVSG